MKRLPLRGTVIEPLGEGTYTRADGSSGRSWRWSITCAVCATPFEFSRPAGDTTRQRLDLGHLRRRCEACREAHRLKIEEGKRKRAERQAALAAIDAKYDALAREATARHKGTP